MILCNRCKEMISPTSMVATVHVRERQPYYITYYHWLCRPPGTISGRRKCATILRELEEKCEPIHHRSNKEAYGGYERSRKGTRIASTTRGRHHGKPSKGA